MKQEEKPIPSSSILLSPYVEIFRKNGEKGYSLFGPPRKISVITAPAPDLRGPAGQLSRESLHAMRKEQILHMLFLMAYKGYRSITLGAWGCGVFLNPPEDVAADFYEVLVLKNSRHLFDSILFAIYCGDDKRNLYAFQRQFGEE